jgi:hypothetical protein
MTVDIGPLLTGLSLVAGLVVFWIGVIRRIDTKVSSKDLHDTLERRDTRVQSDIREVLNELGKQNEVSAEYRKLTTEHLNRLSEDIAVLKDRAGDQPRRARK